MAVKILNGIDVDGSMNIVASDVPNLDASKITSGTFSTDRIPNLSGVYQPAGDYLTLETAETTFQPLGNYLTTTSALDANRISSGTLDGARMPWNSNDGFGGTYSIVWRATNDLYTSSWLQVRGTDDALLTRKIVAGDNPIVARSIGFGDAGLLFQDNDAYKCVHPTTMDGTAHGDSISLGWSNNKWKDGYFGGILYANGGNSNEWNAAYDWGNHASVGYLTSLPSHNHDTLYDAIGSADAVNVRIDNEVFPALNDLGNTIPTNNNQLTNGAGYITSADGGNAATLEGRRANDFLKANDTPLSNTDLDTLYDDDSTLYYSNSEYSTNTNIPHQNYFTLLNFRNPYLDNTGDPANANDRASQLWLGDTPNTFYVRYFQGSAGWHPWEKVWTDNSFSDTNVSNWNTAYGWGNHASVGYLTSIPASYATDVEVNNAVQAVNERIETEVLPSIPTNNNQLTNGAGYITDGNTGWNNSYGFITNSISTGITINGSLSRGTYTSASQYHTGADNIVLKGNGSGISGLFFESEKNGTNINHPSDFGFIQYHAYGTSTSGESNELIIGVSNDADDHVVLNAPNVNGLKFRVGASETEYNVYHSGNLSLSTLGYTGATNANYITNNNQLTNGAGYATQSYVTTQINNVIDSAPGALNTLNELAAALGDDSNFSTTVANNIGAVNERIDAEVLPAIDAKQNAGNYATFSYITLNDSATTASFIAELTTEHAAFQDNYRAYKVGWSYAGNSNLDVGFESVELAGCLIECFGGTYKHVRLTRPTTGTGGRSIYVYNDQGSTYSPGWRQIWTSDEFSSTNVSNWNTAYGWGNHASAGYLTSIPSTYATDAEVNTAVSAVNSRIDTEVLPAIPTNNNQLTNGAGYITDGNTNWNNSYGFITEASYIKAGGAGPSTENLNTIADSVVPGKLEYRGFNLASSNRPPASDNANGVITVGQHSGNYNAQLAFSSDGNMYWRDNPSTSYGSWRTVWDSDNLDAFVGATVSNDTITFTKANGGTVAVTTSDANTNTWRPIDDTPVNGVTTESISSNWAYDHVNASNPHGTTAGDVGADPAGSAAAVEATLAPQISSAQDTADNASTAAASAQTDATDAVALATDAKTRASDAQAAADAAQTTADSKLGATAKAADSDLLDGLDLHTGRNNQANKVVRTNASGYADFGWINTTSGRTTSTLTDIYVNTNDGYIRKATPAHFRSQITDGSYDSIGSADAVNARIDGEVLPIIPFNNNQLTNGAGYITGYTETSTLDSVADRGRTTNQQLISTNPSGFRVDSGSSARIEIDSNNSWSYVRLMDNGAVCWDIGTLDNGNLEWRPSGGDPNRMTLSKTGNLSVSGTIVASDDITAFSDARIKENVETLPNALESVKQMRGVTYNKIGEEKQSVGVIAQELEEVVPQLVHTDEEGMKSVAYGNLTAVLIEALKEQQAQIEELKARLDGLTK